MNENTDPVTSVAELAVVATAPVVEAPLVVVTSGGVAVTPEAVTPTKTKKVKTKAKRATYRFKLTFPEVFTIRQLRNLKKRSIQYITIYKRVEAALKAGEIVEAGKFRLEAQRGRHQTVYVRSGVKNVQLAVTKAFPKGEVLVA